MPAPCLPFTQRISCGFGAASMLVPAGGVCVGVCVCRCVCLCVCVWCVCVCVSVCLAPTLPALFWVYFYQLCVSVYLCVCVRLPSD